ncbi:glycoside hydrolase family 6 protein [Sphaerisporangium dianthi]|uniref:Glucanase n=1 Tax=Sphaerisporangium dianthi TaxID=1436120 RepID=A0ABV9CB50_9ACTN
MASAGKDRRPRWRHALAVTAAMTLAATGLLGARSAAHAEPYTPAHAGPSPLNPYAGGPGYVDPGWAANVEASAVAEGGATADRMRRLAKVPTAVWLDRIAKVTGGPGADRTLRDHLDAALRQRARHITFVVYDLPDRNCANPASAGELSIVSGGLARYKAEYIDPMAEILRLPAYRNLRVALVVEPHSLADLAVTTGVPTIDCQLERASGAYVDGVRYALDKLGASPNVRLYLDAGSAPLMGYEPYSTPFAELVTSTVRGTSRGLSGVRGFATGVAEYVPLDEVFMPDPRATVNGGPLWTSRFFDWNPVFDERDHATALRAALIARGFPAAIRVIIDTSRNGWGGPDRPTAAGTSAQLDTYVDQSRIDRRSYRFNYCNQKGAGLGERPRAEPAAGIDAYVWIKPPGESDGVSVPPIHDEDDPHNRYDVMCDPTRYGRIDPDEPTGALPGAPPAGLWHHAQFSMLVANAHPAL